MRLEKLDLFFSIIIFAFGLYVINTAMNYGLLSDGTAGTGLFSFMGGIIFTVGALGVMIKKLRKSRVLEDVIDRREALAVGLMILATVGFLLLVESVGFIVLTPIYVFLIAFIIQYPTTRRLLLSHLTVAIGFTLCAYGLFGILLETPFPPGWLAK